MRAIVFFRSGCSARGPARTACAPACSMREVLFLVRRRLSSGIVDQAKYRFQHRVLAGKIGSGRQLHRHLRYNRTPLIPGMAQLPSGTGMRAHELAVGKNKPALVPILISGAAGRLTDEYGTHEAL